MFYVCVRGMMDVVFSVCIVTRGAVCARVREVCVFRHADVVCLCLVYCVHPVTVLNAEFDITCSLLILVEDARCDHMEEAPSRPGLMPAF